MRIIYSENGTHYLLTQNNLDTFQLSEVKVPRCAVNLRYDDHDNLTKKHLSSVDLKLNTVDETNICNRDYPGFEDTISILIKGQIECNDTLAENKKDSLETYNATHIESLLNIELDSPIDRERSVTLPVQKYLTSLNIQMVANLFEQTKILAEVFHKNRLEFVKELYHFIDNQISQSALKFIFTDVNEKRIKEEIKVTIKTMTCEGLQDGETREASDLEKNIFNAYNLKNEAFSILGFKEQTQEYFGCFHLDSVNFMFIFKQFNELNKLQINLLKSFATTFNHLILEKRKSAKKRKSENRSKIPANTISTPLLVKLFNNMTYLRA